MRRMRENGVKARSLGCRGPVIRPGLGPSHMAERIHLQVSPESPATLSPWHHPTSTSHSPHPWAIIRLLLPLIGKVCRALSVNKFIAYNCCNARIRSLLFWGV